MSIWKDYYCTTFRQSEDGVYYRHYLFINRRDNDKRQTSFRIDLDLKRALIFIKYQAQWETYAPMIIEYCVNDLKINNIYAEELDGGN